ncbi:MAG: YkgJ family cysteine cluster protein [Candidatus Gastranaerophilales bacterium]|nr:YkgJ family cysteine cluster protein [Candidatus Gastranaerophilales bacterium]
MNIKEFFQYIKFLYNYKFSAKYVVKGKCKACGKCCRSIVFYDGEELIKTKEQFEKAKLKNKRMKLFEISGIDETDGALTFKCKSLGNDGKCKDYFFRSMFCREYPFIIPDFIKNNGQTLEGCGYYYSTNKEFKEFLK